MTAFRLPVRLIEQRFGAGNFDDAGDALAGWLRDCSDGADRHRIGYAFDTAHANPWFHARVVRIDGLPAALCERLRARLREQGLADQARGGAGVVSAVARSRLAPLLQGLRGTG